MVKMLHNVFSMIYESFILELWYFFNFDISIVEIKIKIRIYFKSLVSNNTRTWRLRKATVSSSCHMENSYLSKLVVPKTHTEERFFSVTILLKVCESCLFRQNKKNCWSVWVFFGLPEKRRPSKYYLWEVNLFFYI